MERIERTIEKNKEMKNYGVTIPFGGHLYIEIEAENEKAAIEKAKEGVTLDNLDSWEIIEGMGRGNVCYFPQPWDVVSEEI